MNEETADRTVAAWCFWSDIGIGALCNKSREMQFSLKDVPGLTPRKNYFNAPRTQTVRLLGFFYSLIVLFTALPRIISQVW
jgi:hypothetical protein